MSTQNIHFLDKIEKFLKISLNICFLELSKNFIGKQRVRISHGKRVIVRAIEGLLYWNHQASVNNSELFASHQAVFYTHQQVLKWTYSILGHDKNVEELW